MAKIPNLLPENFEEGNIITPLEILRIQALAFAKRTKNLLNAEVKHQIYSYDDSDIMAEKEKHHVFYDDFYIVAPRLDGYRYSLLRIGQTNTTYPADVWDYPQSLKKEVKNADELIEELRILFSSDATRQIIESLMSQSLKNPIFRPDEEDFQS